MREPGFDSRRSNQTFPMSVLSYEFKNFPSGDYPSRLPLGMRVTLWSDHWTNGGTGITKIRGAEDIQKFAEAVKEFGDETLFVKHFADHAELHCSKPGSDLSEFWAFYHKTFPTPATP